MYNGFLAVGEETQWGTPVARNKFAKIHVGNTLDHEIDQQPSSIIGANLGGDVESMFVKGESGSGTIIIPSSIDDGARMKILKHAFGAVSTTGSSPYTHVFTRFTGPPFPGGAVSNAMGLSVETNYQFPDGPPTPTGPLQARLIEGSLINTLEWGWQAEEECKTTATIIGEQMTQIQQTGSPTYPDLDTYIHKYSQVGIKVDSGGEASQVVLGVSLKIDNKYNTLMTLGSSTTRQPRRKGKGEVTGTLKILWDQTQMPATTANGSGSSSTALVVNNGFLAVGDTIRIGSGTTTTVSALGGTGNVNVTLAGAKTWANGDVVQLCFANIPLAGSSVTALVCSQSCFQNGDYIKIGTNTPVFVTAGGGTTTLTISASQSWSAAATVQIVSSLAKYLWDKAKAKTAVSFTITLTGANSTSETLLVNNVRLGKPNVSPEEGQTQTAEFPFWGINDTVNTAIKLTLVNLNSAV